MHPTDIVQDERPEHKERIETYQPASAGVDWRKHRVLDFGGLFELFRVEPRRPQVLGGRADRSGGGDRNVGPALRHVDRPAGGIGVRRLVGRRRGGDRVGRGVRQTDQTRPSDRLNSTRLTHSPSEPAVFLFPVGVFR